MGIYPGHSPVLTTLRPGIVTVVRDDSAPERIFVKGGMAEVNPQGLTVLAEIAVPVAELTLDSVAQLIAMPNAPSPRPSPERPPARPRKS